MSEVANKPVCINADIVFRNEGDEALLFNPKNGSIRVLNATGVFIWDQLDGKRSYQDLLDLLAQKHVDTRIEILGEHLKAFLKRLAKYNIIYYG